MRPVIAIVFVLVVIGCNSESRRIPVGDPLPADQEVAKVEVDVFYKMLKKSVRKTLPPDFYPALHRTLLPVVTDPEPVKWVVVGELHITKADGSKFFVMFGERYNERLAQFAAGISLESRVYYQGGNAEEAAACYRKAITDLEIAE